MQKTICVTGIDGSGKSTLVNALSNHFTSCHISNIWDLIESSIKGLPFKSKKDVDDYLCELTPDSRLLFLSHAIKYSYDTATKSDKSLIITNSYFYKYFATELALGAQNELVKSLQKSFPNPDIVIELVLPVEEAAKRKNKLSRYECGLTQNPNINSFIDFQTKALKEWHNFDRKNWHKIDATKSQGEILSEVLNIIN